MRRESVMAATPSRPPPAGLRPTSPGPLAGIAMTNSQLHSQKPTRKQLGYLRILAEGCGETFVSPSTKAEASREIKRLKGRRSRSSFERQRERQLQAQIPAFAGDAARVRTDEVSGYGSAAAWSSGVSD
jgi:hypothetical protein